MRRMDNEHNPNWKGDSAKKVAVHHWVKRRKKKTGICSRCEQRRYTEWANVDHEYRHNLDDYIELCKPCHIKLDGPRQTNPWNRGRKGIPGTKCLPGCTCGRHRYWSRRPKVLRD
jgi:hypothetical protein